jgi:hypothetical protein
MFPIDKVMVVPERPAARDVISAARYWDKAARERLCADLVAVGRQARMLNISRKRLGR